MVQRQSPSSGRGLRPASSNAMGPSLFGGNGGPFALLRQLDDDMNRLFQQFYRGMPGLDDEPGSWLPQVELCERAGKLHVSVDVPGMSKDDIQVSLADGQLVIEGERRRESSTEEDDGRFRSERSYGRFCRSIALPEGVNVDSARATCHDGVLDISFDAPAQGQARTRRIDISDEGAPAEGSAAWATGSSGGTQGGGAGDIAASAPQGGLSGLSDSGSDEQGASGQRHEGTGPRSQGTSASRA